MFSPSYIAPALDRVTGRPSVTKTQPGRSGHSTVRIASPFASSFTGVFFLRQSPGTSTDTSTMRFVTAVPSSVAVMRNWGRSPFA